MSHNKDGMKRLIALIPGPKALKLRPEEIVELVRKRLGSDVEIYKQGRNQSMKALVQRKVIIVSILALGAGLLVMYLLDLASVMYHKALTQEIIENSRQTYELQRKITLKLQ